MEDVLPNLQAFNKGLEQSDRTQNIVQQPSVWLFSGDKSPVKFKRPSDIFEQKDRGLLRQIRPGGFCLAPYPPPSVLPLYYVFFLIPQLKRQLKGSSFGGVIYDTPQSAWSGSKIVRLKMMTKSAHADRDYFE